MLSAPFLQRLVHHAFAASRRVSRMIKLACSPTLCVLYACGPARMSHPDPRAYASIRAPLLHFFPESERAREVTLQEAFIFERRRMSQAHANAHASSRTSLLAWCARERCRLRRRADQDAAAPAAALQPPAPRAALERERCAHHAQLHTSLRAPPSCRPIPKAL
eukprot:334356-Pleurochrysis_carterae.AAC.3